MFRTLPDLPTGIIGFEATGHIESDDYRDALVPAINAELDAGRDLRIVLVFHDLEGFSAGATWEDLKMGVEHLTRWKRIAVVTDLEWMVKGLHFFGWMSPGEVRRFAVAEQLAAIDWAAGG
jgi:hypothetical protein